MRTRQRLHIRHPRLCYTQESPGYEPRPSTDVNHQTRAITWRKRGSKRPSRPSQTRHQKHRGTPALLQARGSHHSSPRVLAFPVLQNPPSSASHVGTVQIRSPVLGSSRNTTRGSPIIAIATDNFLLLPPLSSHDFEATPACPTSVPKGHTHASPVRRQRRRSVREASRERGGEYRADR